MDKPLPINYERDIPDYAENEYLYNHIDSLILLSRSGNYSNYDVCVGLWALVVRVANNPGGIDEEHSFKVFEWLKLNWPSGNAEGIDTATAVLVNLRFSYQYLQFLKQQLKSEPTTEGRDIICEAIAEYSA